MTLLLDPPARTPPPSRRRFVALAKKGPSSRGVYIEKVCEEGGFSGLGIGM
jgi:hypothetical protein